MPTGSQSAIHIPFGAPTLPPMAYTMFCLHHQDECRTMPPLFRRGAVRMTEKRWADLKEVNQSVNRSIVPESQGRACPSNPGWSIRIVAIATITQ